MQTSYPKSKVRILLLEGIDINAVKAFEADGYTVDHRKVALSGPELIEAIENTHIIGVRSATKLTAEVLGHAKKLLAIGCFCIGTNQVDLQFARSHGIAVFNSPFSNSRSVAELIIGQIIMLARRLGDANTEMHSGTWFKYSAGRHEVRGTTLAIVGYGNIGSQLSVLAEALGMRVIFYDVLVKLPLGNASATATLEEALSRADFVSLHVPQLASTANMIGAKELACMKKGAYLLNASRGNVVVHEDLAAALKSGHLGGAYVDVFPSEPKTKQAPFETVLRGLPNVTMTPHVGGATEEAQGAIGSEVAGKLIAFLSSGDTASSVNMPQLQTPFDSATSHRILNFHHNRPGVLKGINAILADYNISQQALRTSEGVGYLIVDIEKSATMKVKTLISQLDASIKTRIMF